MRLGFNLQTCIICGLSLLSHPCSERFFSSYSGFPLSQKPIFQNSNSIWTSLPSMVELDKIFCALKTHSENLCVHLPCSADWDLESVLHVLHLVSMDKNLNLHVHILLNT